MNGIVEWLDSLPAWLYFIVTSFSAAFGLGVALFVFTFWQGDKIGLISHVDMRQRGIARSFFGIVLWVMSIPFIVGIFSFSFT